MMIIMSVRLMGVVMDNGVIAAHMTFSPPWTPELQELWAPILASSRPLMICLSTPSAGAGVTSIGTANGAFLLGQFLGERKKDIQLTPSDQLSMPEIKVAKT